MAVKHTNTSNGNGNGRKRLPTSGSWKKGVSGNPNGRPKKGATLADLLDQRLDKAAFVDAVIALALKGNARCIAEIFQRLDGPVTRSTSEATVLRIEYADDLGPDP